jgi:hypothetical protein
MRMTTVAIGLAAGSLLIAPSTALAASHAQPSVRSGSMTCKDDGHKYIHGTKVSQHGSKAKLVGEYLRFHPCGEDDGYFTDQHKVITLTLNSKSKIKVFKEQLDPSATKTVKASKFAAAYKHRSDETWYKYTGARASVKTLTEHFVS